MACSRPSVVDSISLYYKQLVSTAESRHYPLGMVSIILRQAQSQLLNPAFIAYLIFIDYL